MSSLSKNNKVIKMPEYLSRNIQNMTTVLVQYIYNIQVHYPDFTTMDTKLSIDKT